MAGARLLAILAALLTAGAVAATALSAPGDPKHAFRAADQAYARTILLRKADVPGTGWQSTATDFGRVNPLCIVRHYSLSKLTATAEVGFTHTRAVDTGTFLVESDAHVFLNAAQAATAASISAKLGFAKCLAAALVAEVPNGSFASSTVTPVSVSGLAASAKEFRIVLHIVSASTKSTLTATVVELHKGRAFAVLSVLTADKGWSQAQIRSAAATMASRMTKR